MRKRKKIGEKEQEASEKFWQLKRADVDKQGRECQETVTEHVEKLFKWGMFGAPSHAIKLIFCEQSFPFFFFLCELC